jgi:hypothetical protein
MQSKYLFSRKEKTIKLIKINPTEMEKTHENRDHDFWSFNFFVPLIVFSFIILLCVNQLIIYFILFFMGIL